MLTIDLQGFMTFTNVFGFQIFLVSFFFSISSGTIYAETACYLPE